MDLKKIIRSHGQTISSVAEKLGITQSALSQQINNGSISFAKVEQIASICGCSPSSFLVIDGETLSHPAIICPHCGKPIELEIKAKEGK